MTDPVQSDPVLIALNLQKLYLKENSAFCVSRAASALGHAHACLNWARRRRVPVVHVHTLHGERSGDTGPIAGFEPHPAEPLIFKRGASFFNSHELARRFRLDFPMDALVLGFTGTRDCVAAAVDAQRAGARLLFVIDAIASPIVGPIEREGADQGIRAILGEFAGVITTADLLRRESLVLQR